MSAAAIVTSTWNHFARKAGTMSAPPAPASNAEWKVYGGDPSNTRYSALSQINTGNVQDILENFKFRNQLPTLSKADALATLINKFLDPDIDLDLGDGIGFVCRFKETGKKMFLLHRLG